MAAADNLDNSNSKIYVEKGDKILEIREVAQKNYQEPIGENLEKG